MGRMHAHVAERGLKDERLTNLSYRVPPDPELCRGSVAPRPKACWSLSDLHQTSVQVVKPCRMMQAVLQTQATFKAEPPASMVLPLHLHRPVRLLRLRKGQNEVLLHSPVEVSVAGQTSQQHMGSLEGSLRSATIKNPSQEQPVHDWYVVVPHISFSIPCAEKQSWRPS